VRAFEPAGEILSEAKDLQSSVLRAREFAGEILSRGRKPYEVDLAFRLPSPFGAKRVPKTADRCPIQAFLWLGWGSSVNQTGIRVSRCSCGTGVLACENSILRAKRVLPSAHDAQRVPKHAECPPSAQDLETVTVLPMSAPDSRFVRACCGLPVDTTPVWFMRQAGRYMAEYRAVRQQHSILEICKKPSLAADVTITAAEKLGVDAAIIFADLLLPLEVMGVPFRFAAGEGPVIKRPVRDAAAVARLRSDVASELGYVAEAVRLVARHFADRLPVIGFCGAPFTVASYMIEGSGSRSYLETKKMMYRSPLLWKELMSKLVTVLSGYAVEQARAGADVIQIFDSWVGCLAPDDFERYVLPYSQALAKKLKAAGIPVIYFGTDTAGLLPLIQKTGADVIGVDWRVRLDDAWQTLGWQGAVQGNLDPAALLADWSVLEEKAEEVLQRSGGRPGHIFNLGHGIVPETPVENVKRLVEFVHQRSARTSQGYTKFTSRSSASSGVSTFERENL
jgi:uroporphyrinogen decarboxylase